MPTKKWYESRTVWLGILEGFIAGIEVYKNGGTAAGAALAFFSIVSIALRGYTDRPLDR